MNEMITNYGHIYYNNYDICVDGMIGKATDKIENKSEGIVHVVGYNMITINGTPVHLMSLPFQRVVFLSRPQLVSYIEAMNFCVKQGIPADYCVMQSVVNSAILIRDGDFVVAMGRKFPVIGNILICDDTIEPKDIRYDNRTGLYLVVGSKNTCAGVMLDKIRFS